MQCHNFDRWKAITGSYFGKKGKSCWRQASMDIMCVDVGLKPSCLFDHWLACPEIMLSYLKNLYREGLTSRELNVLKIGMDIVIFNQDHELWSDNLHQPLLVNVSLNLEKPSLISYNLSDMILETTKSFKDFCKSVKGVNTVVSIDMTDTLNAPCLFGLLLFYPCVYFYDRTYSENNNLSCHSLHVFQVKGYIPSVNKSSECSSTERVNQGSTHKTAWTLIYSFSVPETVISDVRDNVLSWYDSWEKTSNWSRLFAKVSLSEEKVSPKAVCL